MCYSWLLGECLQVAGVQGFLFIIVLGSSGGGSSAAWMVGYGTALRPHLCPGSDPLNSLKCVGFVSSLSGKDKQCMCSGKFEL